VNTARKAVSAVLTTDTKTNATVTLQWAGRNQWEICKTEVRPKWVPKQSFSQDVLFARCCWIGDIFCKRYKRTARIVFIIRICRKIWRLRWSRSSVLAFSTQVCGFKPCRSRRIFRAKKILSTPSFGGEVKLSVPCRRFAAYKRSLNLRGSRNLGKITTGRLSRPQFHLSLPGSVASLRTEALGG